MLAPALLLGALCAQTPALVQTASTAEDPFESLWTPSKRATPPLPSGPGAPHDLGPGAPRLDAPPAAPRLDTPPTAAPRLDTPPTAVQPAAPVTLVKRTAITRWYRWPILGLDALFAAITFVGFGLENAPLVATGALGYAFSAPAVHWGYGNLSGGMASVTTHALAPTAIGLLGALFSNVVNDSNCSGSSCGGSDRPWFFAGVAIGAAATTALDVLVFAHVDEEVPAVTLTPTFGTVDGVTHVGLGGRF